MAKHIHYIRAQLLVQLCIYVINFVAGSAITHLSHIIFDAIKKMNWQMNECLTNEFDRSLGRIIRPLLGVQDVN